jgi:hypothetical protein
MVLMYPPWFDGLHPSRFLHINCRADNHRMQQLARRFGAKVSFDVERAVSEIETSRTTPLSWMRELVSESHGLAIAVLDAQSRILKGRERALESEQPISTGAESFRNG